MIVLVTSFPARALFVYAESNSSDSRDSGENRNKEDILKQNENEDEEDEDGQSDEEQDIFSLVAADHEKSQAVKVPEVDEKSLLTYADVVNVIKSYENTVSQISADAGVDTGRASLSAGEKALLDNLLGKHHNQFSRLNNRIAEVNTQLKQLEDLLSPLGTQPISTMYGIKGLLVSELNNFKDIINGISEFDDLNLQILQEETN